MGNVLTPARRLFYRGQNPRSMRAFPAEPGALRLLAGLRKDSIGATKPNTPAGTAWATSNPRAAATYQDWGGPVLLLDEAEPPAEVFDARGAFWNDWFADRRGDARDFYRALKDPRKMSLEVRNVVDPGPGVWNFLASEEGAMRGGEEARDWLRRLFAGDNLLVRRDAEGRAPALRWHGTEEVPRFAGGGLVALKRLLSAQKAARPVDMVKLRLMGFDVNTPFVMPPWPYLARRMAEDGGSVKLYRDPDSPEFLGEMDTNARNLYYGLQSGLISDEDLRALRAEGGRGGLPWTLHERAMGWAGSAARDSSFSSDAGPAYFPVLARLAGEGDPGTNWGNEVLGQSVRVWEPEKSVVSLFDPRPDAVGRMWTPRDVDDYGHLKEDPEWRTAWFAQQDRYEDTKKLRRELQRGYPRAAPPELGPLRRAARARQEADFAPPRYNVGGAVRCAAARGGT